MSRRTIKKGANWSVERRYEFMEFRLFWQGHINRGDLMEAFGISVQQASKDFANYIECRKSNLIYDKRLRTYLRGKNFKPRYFKPDAAEYFSQLQAVEQGLVPEAQSWISDFPGYAATPVPARGVDPLILREVLSAIRDQVALKITYQSMSRPKPSERWIAPHALAFDGFRWHARAFCQNDGVFKDFLFSRIVEVGEQVDASSAAENDTDWHSEIILKIGPHPELSDTQRQAIEMDYGMVDGKAEIVVRKALLFYALKRLGLDTDPTARRPRDQQIVLLEQKMAIRPPD
jgi:predicted DNA-binding transcriptional regulator YafY